MKTSVKTLKRLWFYLRVYRVKFIAALFFQLIAIGLNAIFPYVTGLPTTRIKENLDQNQAIDFDYILFILGMLAVIMR